MTTINGNNTGSVTTNTVQKTFFTPTTESTALNVSSNAAVTSNTFILGDTAFAYMRAKAITFTVKGLKPNTQYYPFFNDVDVAAYCSTTNGSQSSNIVTNSLGDITGIFYLPANTFLSGSYTFKLVDNTRTISSKVFPDPLYGSAEAQYEANGVLKQLQTQVTINVIPPTEPPITAPTNQVNPPVTCEEWYFNYRVTDNKVTNFSVVTTSSTAPASPKPEVGFSTNTSGTTTYVSTTPLADGKYEHNYTYSVTGKSLGDFKQKWVGKSTDTRPSTTGFRPTGIPSTATVTILKDWTFNKVVACPVNLGLKTPKRIDPLAQSFFIDQETYPNGVFATSINVYFRTVDQSTPVMLELRNMVNGTPGPNILPNGKVILPGYAAGQSDDASLATKFTFDQPVYLLPNTEYCFVIKSTSLGYAAWCSRFGELDVANGTIIEAQPFNGTLFKSENDSTWTPDQYEDIKFDFNIAQFDITKNGDVKLFQRLDTDKYESTRRVLPLSAISTTNASTTVGLKIPLHGLNNSDKIVIADIASGSYNGIAHTNLIGEFTVTYVDEDNVTIVAKNSDTASATGSLVSSDTLQTISSVLPNALPAPSYENAEPVVNPGTNSLSIVPATPSNPTIPTAVSSANSSSFTVYTNIPMSEVMIDYMGAEPEGTSIVERIKATDTNYVKDSSFTVIDNNQNYYLFNEPKIVATKPNETLRSVTDSLEVNLLLNSSSKDVSPVVDLTGFSLMAKAYNIDNQNSEITDLIAGSGTESDFNDPAQNSEILAARGLAQAKYKSQVNQTADFYTIIQLFVVGTSPSPAVIDAYVRTSTDEFTHEDRNWKWMPINGTFGTAFNSSSSSNTVNEWYYEVNVAEPFNVYDIKLVMRSTDTSVVPKIYGVRTILNK